MQLKGKVAIVTGASRGVGKGIATVFGREGATVVVVARTERARGGLPGTIHETAEKIRGEGGSSLAVRCDVTSPSDVDTMVRETLQAFGRIDILVNNAGGTASLLRIEDCPLEDFDKTMALNVRGTFLCCKAVIPVMKAQGSGVIINLSSRAGSQVTVPGDTVYGAAKAAIDRFSIGLGSEIKPYGIAVIAASPGRVKTETAVHSLRGKDADWSGWREPEDVGPAFVWLARQTADTFTMRVVNATDFGAKWP